MNLLFSSLVGLGAKNHFNVHLTIVTLADLVPDDDDDDDDDDGDDDDGTTYALCLGPHQVILAKVHFPQSGRIFITVTFSNLRSVGPFLINSTLITQQSIPEGCLQ